MKSCVYVLFTVLFIIFTPAFGSEVGITPEQIYQASIDWQSLIGTWEVLPDENPLAERLRGSSVSFPRNLMTLRKDGTCRVFSSDHPMGSDGLWTFENHEMFIKLPGGITMQFYVYGIKRDFMITRSPIVDGKDHLWSKIK